MNYIHSRDHPVKPVGHRSATDSKKDDGAYDKDGYEKAVASAPPRNPPNIYDPSSREQTEKHYSRSALNASRKKT